MPVDSKEEEAINFFKKIKERIEWGSLDDEGKRMIEENPELLKMKCPVDIEDSDFEGRTVTECICSEMSAGSRDLLEEIVAAGAEITDGCYDLVNEDGITIAAYWEVFFASGHLLTSHKFALDWMVESCDDDPLDSGELDACMQMLLKRATPKTSCSFGNLGKLHERSLKLPTPKAGETHEEGGPFEEFMKEWVNQHGSAKRSELSFS